MSAALLEHGCRLPQDGRMSHAYLHALIENNPVAVAVLDSRHSFQMCNAAFARMFQYSASDLEMWGIDDSLAGPDFLDEARDATHAVLMGRQVHFRSKRRRRDGLLIDVDIQGIPLLLDGRVEGVYGLYQDVTESLQFSDFMARMTAERTASRPPLRGGYTPPLHGSLSQELALLGLSLKRLERLLQEQGKDAEAVLDQTQTLAAMCADLVREDRPLSCDAPAGALPQNHLGLSGRARLSPMRSCGITDRETEIIRLLAAGLSSKEVACCLGIGTRTVETHRLNVYRKLHLRNVADLVLFAVRHDLLPPEGTLSKSTPGDTLNLSKH